MNYRDISIPKTRQDYNLIAQDFSSRRQIISPDMKSLGQFVKDGDSVMDFGCGDGRLLKAIKAKNINYFGTDISNEMIKIAIKQFPERLFSTYKPTLLKRYNNYFEIIFSIAVFHHIPENKRLNTLRLLYSCLKPGGQLILTVWQANKNIRLIKWTKILDRAADYFVPYTTKNNITVNRYIHLYSKEELENLLLSSGFTNIKISESFRGNTVVNSNFVVRALKPNRLSN